MTAAQKRLAELRDKASRNRQRLAELAMLDELSDETRSELDTLESAIPDTERLLRAAQASVDEEEVAQRRTRDDDEGDTEDRERRDLRRKVRLSSYVGAAIETRAVDGAEAEYNAAIGLPGNRFPLELLAPERRTESRATTNADASTMQGMWLDRLFSDTAAGRLGVTFRSVEPGVAAYPVTTAGASAAQRGRTEKASDASWTVSVSEIKPTRNAVRVLCSEEDAMRLPGLEDALRRDLAMSIGEGVDRAVFIGDTTANEDRADIAGLTAATGIVEKSLTQANKVKPGETLGVFSSLIDGKHALNMGDLNIVSAVGANTLWDGTILEVTPGSDSLSVFKTMANFLREQGLSWSVRGDIETATANGDWGAFVGRGRGIEGAGVAAVWNSGLLIRDPYSAAASGEVALTLSYFWGLAFPRPTNFARLKFVT